MIGKAIYEMLKLSAELAAIPVSPMRTAQLLAMPLITYMVTDNAPTAVKNGVSKLDVVSFAVNVFTNDYGLTQELGEAVRKALDRQCGYFGGLRVESISFEGYDDVYDDNAEVFILGLDFKMRASSGIIYPDYATIDYSANDYFTTL